MGLICFPQRDNLEKKSKQSMAMWAIVFDFQAGTCLEIRQKKCAAKYYFRLGLFSKQDEAV